MAKIGKRVVDRLRPVPGRDVFAWDSELRGFGVRVKPSGTRAYLVQYRNAHGRSRRFTLKNSSALAPDEARAVARDLLAKIAKGYDPAAEKSALRGQITVSELCSVYLKEEAGRIKASTLAMDRSRIYRHVVPLLGNRTVASLTPRDIERFMKDIERGKTAKKQTKRTKAAGKVKRERGGRVTGGKGVAARTVGMLGTILQRAVRDGVIDRNPARGIKRPKENLFRPAFSWSLVGKLSTGLMAAEDAGEKANALNAIRLLLLTGCRRMEILTLTWGEVDMVGRCFRLSETKSGAQMRPVGRRAFSILKKLPRSESEDFVFPGSGKSGHFVGLPKVFERVLKLAEINNLSLHGLRHWFASAATAMDFSELTIAGLLGHRVKGVTARYASAPDSALANAADKVSTKLASILSDPSRADDNVVNLDAKAKAKAKANA